MSKQATFGFDYTVGRDESLLLKEFEPFSNKNKLLKTDIELSYNGIEKSFCGDFTIDGLTWDLPFEWSKIDYLTVFCETPEDFMIKLESKSSPNIGINQFLHLQFSKAITKFYLSNPNQNPIDVRLVYLSNTSVSDRINDNLYKKSDTNLYWHIKHNLGYEPDYGFLDLTGKEIEPDYSLEIFNKNELLFNFTDIFNGYVFFNRYFMFVEPEYSDTWTISHNLDKYPSVVVFDTLGGTLDNYTRIYESPNIVKLVFDKQQAGKAILY